MSFIASLPWAVIAAAAKPIVHDQTYESWRDFVMPALQTIATVLVAGLSAFIAFQAYRFNRRTSRDGDALKASINDAERDRRRREDRQRLAKKMEEFVRLAVDEMVDKGSLLPTGHEVGRRSALEAAEEALYMAISLPDEPNAQTMVRDAIDAYEAEYYKPQSEWRTGQHRARQAALRATYIWVMTPEGYPLTRAKAKEHPETVPSESVED